MVNFDHLYLGGGNAKQINFALPPDVTIVPNSDGLTGGIALWDAEDAGAHNADAAGASAAPAPHRAGAARPGADPTGARPTRTGRTTRASQPKTAVAFAVPDGACDCHVHVFGERGGVSVRRAARLYPAAGERRRIAGLAAALRLSRVVIVQPSVYGSDNSCTLDGMRRLGSRRPRGRGHRRGDDAEPRSTRCTRAGIRGVRVNLETAGETDPDAARRNLAAAVERVAPLGWHVQVYTGLRSSRRCRTRSTRLQVPIVFDHFGGAQAAGGVDQPGFAALLALVAAGQGLCQGLRPLIAARTRRPPTPTWRRWRGR